jgi:hypothetical protein
MEEVRRESAETTGPAMAKAIDNSYPWCERRGWAYKAWLAARRDFFRKHSLPLRHARKPAPDLLSEAEHGT